MSTAVLVAFVGAAAGLGGALIAQVLNWSVWRRKVRTSKVRIQGALRELYFLADRASNEVHHKSTVGIYRDRWDEGANKLQSILDSGESPLTDEQMSLAYAAVFACKEAIFGSDRGFDQSLLEERVRVASARIEEAQSALRDPDPTFIVSA